MIESKSDYIAYIKQDAIASRRTTIKPHLFGDYVWKWHLLLRKCEYQHNCFRGVKRLCSSPIIKLNSYRYLRLSARLGFTIPYNVFGPGFSIAHYGTIIVNNNARVGANCRCQTGVCLGATNGTNEAPVLGNNIFLGEGCKLLGGITIANDVAIGANAVVTKDILEQGTHWVPAKKISDNDSHSNLAKALLYITAVFRRVY